MSKTTIDIIKNFSQINQGLVFDVGTQLRTRNVAKSIYAKAEIPDSIPREFVVYDVMTFLAAYGQYSKEGACTIQFNELNMNLIGGKKKLLYHYSNKNLVVYPEKLPQLPSVDFSCILTADMFESMNKMSGIMGLQDIYVSEEGLKLLNINTQGQGNQSNEELYEVDSEIGDQFKPSRIKIQNMPFLSVDYRMELCSRGIASFTSLNDQYKVTYYVSLTSME